MPPRDEPVDGAQTLAQQEMALRLLEPRKFAKVVTYTKSPEADPTGAKVNTAKFEGPVDPQPASLHLEQADNDTQAASVIDAQKKAGRTVAFGPGTAYVESKEKIVIGFR